jgi:hypothetical protein
MEHHIVVTVQGGVAEVCEDTLPPGVVLAILDFDNMEADEESEMSHWSPELREYWKRNHERWGSVMKRVRVIGAFDSPIDCSLSVRHVVY